MTRDEILKMPAGIEMDALIAEKVMRAKLLGFHPSTRVSAAWEVVEKANITGVKKVIGNTPDDYLWFACCGDASTALETEALAETAPLAICRAALLAAMPL